MSEDGSVIVLDACKLTVQPEEQCGYFGKHGFSFFCKPAVHGHSFIRGQSWYFCLAFFPACAACWPWSKALDKGRWVWVWSRDRILRSPLILPEQKAVCATAGSVCWYHSWKGIRRQNSIPKNSSMNLKKLNQTWISMWARLLWVPRSCKCLYEVTWNFLWFTVRRH